MDKLSDCFVCRVVVDDLRASTKEELIDLLLTHLAEAGHLARDVLPGVRAAILKRERLGSTAIGRGIAIPHGKHPSLGRALGVLALVKNGLNFESLDGEPVYVVALLVAPETGIMVEPDPDRSPLRWLLDEPFCQRLRQATASEDLSQLLREADEKWGGWTQ